MVNKRGRGWDFPEHRDPEQHIALLNAKIKMLEQRNEQLTKQIDWLKDVFAGQGVPSSVYELEALEVLDEDSG